MASRYATRPGRPSVNSSSRHSARNAGDSTSTSNSFNQRRNRDSGGSEEEDASTSTFPMWKTIGVVAVVIGCFAAVYPKMFHPMMLYALGYGQSQKEGDSELFPHPSMKHGPHASAQSNFAGPNVQNARQHAPGPGARAPMPGMGPGMNPMGEGGGRGGSKSMWHWMLPFYTVGVIIFLLYTLSKILWKKPKKDPNGRRRVKVRYNSEKDRLETDEPEFEDEDDEVQEEDEDGEDGALNNNQLRGLQRRLHDTEHTMHEILSQLEQLSTTADPSAAENIKKMTLETLGNLGKLNTDRAAASSKSSQDLGFAGANGGRGKGGLRFDATERRYLNDLQKALSDFKAFTENYIDEHAPKQAPPEERNGAEDVDGSGFGDENGEIGEASGSNVEHDIDVMESEMGRSSEELKVEPGEGELIRLNDKTAPQGDELDNENNLHHQRSEETEKKNKKHVRQRKGKRQVRSEE